jgi:hypothetical protein
MDGAAGDGGLPREYHCPKRDDILLSVRVGGLSARARRLSSKGAGATRRVASSNPLFPALLFGPNLNSLEGACPSARVRCESSTSFCHPLEIVVLRHPSHGVSQISALAVCGARRRSGTNHMTATAAYTTYDPTGMTNAKPTPAA